MRSIPAQIIGKKLLFNDTSFARFAEANNGRWCDIIARKPLRSLSQNNYYWLYLTIVANETGNDIDEMHRFFKGKFLPVSPVVLHFKDGKEFSYNKLTSTTELSKAEFGEYLDKICAMTGIPLPDPQAAGYLPH